MRYRIENAPRLAENEMMQKLHRAATVYDKYADRFLLFIFRQGANVPYRFYEVFFGRRNFMHLVGVRSKRKNAEEFFRACLDESLKKKDCDPSGSPSAMYAKINGLESQLDFRNSKCYKLGEKTTVTKSNDFEFATGNQDGLIGYDRRVNLRGGKEIDPRKVAIPTTFLNKSLSEYCSHPQKIMFVLSKEGVGDTYAERVYEIKKGLIEQEKPFFGEKLLEMISP